MNTSNFVKSGNNQNAISIARGTPNWYNGRTFIELAPEWWLIRRYHKDKDVTFYQKEYQKILDKLDPLKVYNELGEDAILLCWEPEEQFCHRHLVAYWFDKELGIEVKEL